MSQETPARRLLKKAWPPIGGCWGIWDGFVMQGFERSDRELPDAAALAGHLVPAGSMFAFLAVHRAEAFRDADYADLFAPGAGRASLPATRMRPGMHLQGVRRFSEQRTGQAGRV